MTAAITIRHVVSIAGCVRERASALLPLPAHDVERRLAGALVEIIGGPPAFELLRAAAALNPRARTRQPDRSYTQADGIYFFVDLPAGAYRLRISAPQFGSRFGAVETAPIDVLPPAPAASAVSVARADVELPSTRVRGVITRADTGEPVAQAFVHVRGDSQSVHTDGEGRYELRRMVQGRPTLEVIAPKLVSARRTVTLAAGQEQVVDIQLDPLQ